LVNSINENLDYGLEFQMCKMLPSRSATKISPFEAVSAKFGISIEYNLPRKKVNVVIYLPSGQM
jgi:hypothetical protein